MRLALHTSLTRCTDPFRSGRLHALPVTERARGRDSLGLIVHRLRRARSLAARRVGRVRIHILVLLSLSPIAVRVLEGPVACEGREICILSILSVISIPSRRGVRSRRSEGREVDVAGVEVVK